MAMPAKWAVMAAFGVALATSGTLAADKIPTDDREDFLEYLEMSLPDEEEFWEAVAEVCGGPEEENGGNGDVVYWLAGRPVSEELYRSACCQEEWIEEWDEIEGCPEQVTGNGQDPE